MKKDALEHSSVWRDRYEHSSYYLQEVSAGFAGGAPSLGRKGMTEAALQLLQKADQMGGLVRWSIAEEAVRAKHGTLDFDQVKRVWRQMMFDSENSSHPLDHSAMIRYGRKQAWFRPFMLFRSPATKIVSNLVQAASDLGKGDMKGARLHFAATLFNFLIVAALRATIDADWQDDDDEDVLASKYMHRVVREVTSLFPIVGDFADEILKSIAGKAGIVYSPSVVDDLLRDSMYGAGEVFRAFNSLMERELDSELNPTWPKKTTNAMVHLLEVGQAFVPVPVSGPLSLVEDVKKHVVGPPEQSLRQRLSPTQESVTQANRQIVKAAETGDVDLLALGVQELIERRGPQTREAVERTLLNRYNSRGLSAYRKWEKTRQLPEGVTLDEVQDVAAAYHAATLSLEPMLDSIQDMLVPSAAPARPGGGRFGGGRFGSGRFGSGRFGSGR